MTEAQLHDILNDPARLEHFNIHELRSLQIRYPYASVFYMLAAIRQKMDTGEVDPKTLAKAAAFAPDRVRLMQHINRAAKSAHGSISHDLQFSDTATVESGSDSDLPEETDTPPTVLETEAEVNAYGNGLSEMPGEMLDDQEEDSVSIPEHDEAVPSEQYPEDPHSAGMLHQEDGQEDDADSALDHDDVILTEKFPEDPHSAGMLHQKDGQEEDADSALDHDDVILTEKFPEDPHATGMMHQEDGQEAETIVPEARSPLSPVPDTGNMQDWENSGIGITEEQRVINKEEEEKEIAEESTADFPDQSTQEEEVDVLEAYAEITARQSEEQTDWEVKELHHESEPEESGAPAVAKLQQPGAPVSFTDFLSRTKPVDLLRSLPPEELSAVAGLRKKTKKGIRGIPGSFEPDPIRPQTIEKHRDIASETLAQILVIQEKYEEALEMYKILQLKIPKKSTYFALQIRELEKKLSTGSQFNN